MIKLTDSEIVMRLEQKLDELLKEQWSCTAKMFDPDMSKRINDLEWIRGRRFIKCNVCHEDLTLKTCKHHNKIKNGDIRITENDKSDS